MPTPQRANHNSGLGANTITVVALSKEDGAELANSSPEGPVAMNEAKAVESDRDRASPPVHPSDGNNSDEDDRLLDELQTILANRYRSDFWVKEKDEFAAQCFAQQQQQQWGSESDTLWSTMATPLTGKALPPNPPRGQSRAHDSNHRQSHQSPRTLHLANHPSENLNSDKNQQPESVTTELDADLASSTTVDSCK